MRRLALLVLLLSVEVFSAQQPQNPANSSIEGVVVDTATNQPIEDTRVTLYPLRSVSGALSPTGPARLAVTVADGKFEFKGLTPGVYRVDLASNGYARQFYGQKTFPGDGSAIEVAAGQSIKGITARMMPVGSVSGRIRKTKTGQALASVPVRLLRVEYNASGQRVLRQYVADRTNDRGEYRLYYVTPGRYLLNAGGMFIATPEERLRELNEVPFTYTSVYYPGVANTNEAVTLEVKPGEERSGIDLNVADQELHRIRGRVIDARTGQSPPAGNVFVYRRVDSAWERIDLPSNFRAPEGGFEFRGLVSGSYLLLTNAMTTPQRNAQFIAPLSTRPRMQTVSFSQASSFAFAPNVTSVEVSGSDVDGIVVSMTEGVPVTGRVSIERQTNSAPNISRLQVVLSSYNGLLSSPLQVTPPAQNLDSTFRADNLAPGEYRVSVTGLPSGLYVKSLRFGALDAAHNPIPVSPRDSNTLNIAISPNVAAIEGIVQNERFEPAAGSVVVIVPDQDRDRSELFQTVSADKDGRFKFSSVPPRSYKLFAWEAMEPYSYFDPNFLQRSEQKGKPVQLDESMKLNVALTVIPMNN